jgi:RNA polymerase sigma-70 factor (ECF subfamily)
LQFTKSQEDSEEIVQDVFVNLWTNREKIKQENTLCSLLFIMTKHHVINAFRAKINQPIYEIYVEHNNKMSVNETHQYLEYQEFVMNLKKAIGALPITQQKVITLSKMQQLSNREIAEKLSLSEQTIKNQLSLGLKMLRQELGKLYFLCMLFVC